MLKILKTTYRGIKDFNKREWNEADSEHFGKDADWYSKWGDRKIILKATLGKNIVGTLILKVEGRVALVYSLIVTKSERNRGVGRKLMLAADEKAKQLKCHKIWLETGDGWPAIHLYKSIGYKKTTDLPNHYFKKDFVLFTKFI